MVGISTILYDQKDGCVKENTNSENYSEVKKNAGLDENKLITKVRT